MNMCSAALLTNPKLDELRTHVQALGTWAHKKHQLLLHVASTACIDSRSPLYRFPYLKEYDWYPCPGRQDLGQGDSIFEDESGQKVLILELKALREGSGDTASRSRTHARKKAKEQAIRYAKAYKLLHPTLQVFAACCCEQLSLLESMGGYNQPDVVMLELNEDHRLLPQPRLFSTLGTTRQSASMYLDGSFHSAPRINTIALIPQAQSPGIHHRSPHYNSGHTDGGTPNESGSTPGPAKTHLQKVRVLESLVEHQGAAVHGEHQLLLMLVQAPQHMSRLSEFPYLKDFEWFSSPNRQDLGRGDAMFVDATGGKVLILELKTLHMGSGKTAQTSRNAAKKKAKQQATNYAANYKRIHPQFQVFAGTCCEQLSLLVSMGGYKQPEVVMLELNEDH